MVVIDIARHHEERRSRRAKAGMDRLIAGIVFMFGQVAADDDRIRRYWPEPVQHAIEALQRRFRAIGMNIAELGDDHSCWLARTNASTERGVNVAVPSASDAWAVLSDSIPMAQSPSGRRATTGSVRRLNQTSTSSSLWRKCIPSTDAPDALQSSSFISRPSGCSQTTSRTPFLS